MDRRRDSGVISRWNGPISVALFVPDVEFSIAETFIEYLRNCYPAVKRQVVMIKMMVM